MSVQPGDISPADWGLLRMLDLAILKLRPGWRHVILLRFYGGKSHRQVATELNLREDTVRRREVRAVMAVCKYCGGRGSELSEDAANRLLAVAFAMPAPSHLVGRITAAVAAEQGYRRGRRKPPRRLP